MKFEDYKRFYVDFIETILGPSVLREMNCDLKLAADEKRQAEYENQKNGLIVLKSSCDTNVDSITDTKNLPC